MSAAAPSRDYHQRSSDVLVPPSDSWWHSQRPLKCIGDPPTGLTEGPPPQVHDYTMKGHLDNEGVLPAGVGGSCLTHTLQTKKTKPPKQHMSKI